MHLHRLLARNVIFIAAAVIRVLCWPMMCGAQMVGPTPQPQGIPVTPEQAEQVEQETWAIHGQTTNVWLLQPAFRSPYQGPQSLSPATNGRETIDATLSRGLTIKLLREPDKDLIGCPGAGSWDFRRSPAQRGFSAKFVYQ